MAIKILSLLVICMLQYTLSMDLSNCTNSTGSLFAGTADNPKMKFFLYTNKNFYDGHEIISGNNTTLIDSNFNRLHPTRILIHGFKNSYFSCFNGYVKDAYLKRGDFNVFVVDWSDWSRNTNYIKVAGLIYKVLGKLLGEFTMFLNVIGGVSFDDMYLIGHSLGAQMAGAAGQFLKPDNKYNTIFALDPAGPSFLTEENDLRLSSDDAKYVEQISTNMGELGYSGIIGHSAFYPNFGRFQKYCLTHDLKRLACSHSASYWYFAESLNSETQFCGRQCKYNTIALLRECPPLQCDSNERFLMGGEPSIPKVGTYYISVNYNPPFAKCNCK